MSNHLITLFLDLNSYFASVEQQLRPELRDHPVAVVPLMSDATCCIAASYEAKAFGIRTGTNVKEAKRLCPKLRIVEARHERYIDFHHRIIAAVDTCIPVEAIHSIDEMSARLLGVECQEVRAVEIAHNIKRTITEWIGEYVRCSIGIAPNQFLAKLATNLHKPDGLVVIRSHELPQRLFSLKLTDLPGIASRTQRRLNSLGIYTVEELCALNEMEMVRLFHSVLGRYWYRRLRGEQTTDAPTHRRSIGHQHVLPPKLRNDVDAHAVATRLLHKAAARARRLRYWAGRLTLHIRHNHQPGWSAWTRLNDTQDTLEMIQALTRLWQRRPDKLPQCVGVTLHHLTAEHCVTQPLFPQQRRRMKLCAAIDQLNVKYGRNVVYPATMHDARDSAPLRIAFRSVPDPRHDL